MSDDKTIETVKAAWQAQRVDTSVPSIDYLRYRAHEHARESRTRSFIEYLCACAVIIMGIWLAAAIDGMFFRAGVLVVLAGSLYSLYEWRRRRWMWAPTLEATAENALHFYKRELARLRDAHLGLWKVYLPSVPGAVILLGWIFLERLGPDSGWRVIGLTCAVVVWIIVMLRHEAQEAKRYQRELDALEQNAAQP